MRVSTSQTYLQTTSLMSKLTQQANVAQQQISTQKRVVSASDDPGAYRQLAGLKLADANDKAYAANVNTAQGILEQSSDTLTSIGTQLQRAQELFTNAASGTLSASDREAIGKELESIRDTLVSLANSKDSRGLPLFGGASGDNPYIQAEDGSVSYAATGEPAGIPIGDQTSIQVGVTGKQAFAVGDDKDMFAIFSTFLTALQSGGDVQVAAKQAMGDTTDALQSVDLARTSVGARGTRLELLSEQLTNASMDRETTRASVEDVDLSEAITQLQKTLTVLQATQASFTKLTSLSLFDYIK
jgi:flagellar hook-associated protein 3 FlgL